MDDGPVQLLLRPGRRRSSTSTSTRSRSRRSAPARRLQRPVLRGAAGGGRARGLAGRRRDQPRRPRRTPSSACRSARRASTRSARRSSRPSQPQVFNDSNDTVRALKGKRVDAIVVDLPTAFYLIGAEVPRSEDRRAVRRARRGQVGPAAGRRAPTLTSCVNEALGKLELGRAGQAAATSGWAATAAPPLSLSRQAARAEAARRRAARRDRLIATVSTVVVLGLSRAAIVTSKGWPTVRETFFRGSRCARRFPTS